VCKPNHGAAGALRARCVCSILSALISSEGIVKPLSFLHVSLCIPLLLRGQTPGQSPLRPGAHIRLRSSVPRDTAWRLGSLVSADGDSVRWVPWHQADTLSVATTNLERWEVSRGRRRHVLHGLAHGFLVGVVTGGVIGYASGGNNDSFIVSGRGGTAVALGAVLGVAGAATGALFGIVKTDDWVRMPSHRASLSVTTVRNRGIALSVAIRF
jgi:hypothetical protein